MKTDTRQTLLIVDFGSQYNLLIARRIREMHVFCEIVPHGITEAEILHKNVKGVILSGGPASIYDARSVKLRPYFMNLGVPILGICYGLQALCHHLGGHVKHSAKREYGRAHLSRSGPTKLFAGIPQKSQVWMSHADKVTRLPRGFHKIGFTTNCAYAGIENVREKIYGLQFHPEVFHTTHGTRMLENFVYSICGFKGNWSSGSFIQRSLERVRRTVGKDEVILGLSGGVDSSVVAALLSKAVGNQLACIFVDNGLLRKGEREQVEKIFRKQFHIRLHTVNARRKFVEALKGVTDPETKRKIIGRAFIEVFQKETKKFKRAKYLAQGTLYPDVIESRSAYGGPSATIKTHHNVGGLPKDMKFKLIEPLRELFKDEVREVGKKLGLSRALIGRHPFPGPGLGVRIMGEVTEERLNILREADDVFIRGLIREGLYAKVWQAFAVFIPVKTVGVMGDRRTYENVLALRAVTSRDGMTADWAHLPNEFLAKISNQIINEVYGINRVVYDISSKPPATIEWE